MSVHFDPERHIYTVDGVQLPGVTEVETVTGEYDLIVLVTAPDAADLDRVLDTVAGWRETRRTTTWVVLKRYT